MTLAVSNFVGDRIVNDLRGYLDTEFRTVTVDSVALVPIVDASYASWEDLLEHSAGAEVNLFCWLRNRTSPHLRKEVGLVDGNLVYRVRVGLRLAGLVEMTSDERRALLKTLKEVVVEVIETNRTFGGDAYESTIEDEQEWAPREPGYFGFEFTWKCQFKYWFA